MRKLREELRMQLHGFRLSAQLRGKHFTLYETMSYLLPEIAKYISVYFSGRVITALTQNAPFAEVFRFALIAVFSVFLIWFVRRLFARRWLILLWSSYYRREAILTKKALTVDYATAESHHFSDLLGRVEENSNLYMGVAAQGRQASMILTNLFSVCIALVMASGMVIGRADGELHGILKLANSSWFGALFSVFVLVMVFLSLLGNDAAVKRRFREREKMGKTNAIWKYYYDRILNENGSGEDIRIYREKPLILEEMRERVFLIRKQIIYRVMRINCTFGMVSTVVTALLGGAVYLFVGLKALAGAFGAGKVVEYYGVLTNMILAFSALANEIGLLRSNRVHLREDLEYYDLKPTLQNGTRTIEDLNLDSIEFEFHDVSFRYPETDVNVLEHLSLTIRIGERLAIVGRNGSGKTTMVKLLCRLYDPTEGYITVNGIDIREFDQAEYRKIYGIVFQDFDILAFSVAENVACSAEYDEEKVWRCLEFAGLRERVEAMPKNLRQCVTALYEKDGVDLSGGEEQKLAIARALYKEAPFVILDEPTAALDPKSESEIYSRFDEISGGRTAVYISHRMSSCRFCDRIAVFADGRVIEQGTHASLLRKNGEYAELWNAQAQHYAET
ncbi:MAG: ABC transporter ATP-binding protein [Clostridia bacterium]|nr:ABC transporter ATP-binding protein [Clostridia bacterium]